MSDAARALKALEDLSRRAPRDPTRSHRRRYPHHLHRQGAGSHPRPKGTTADVAALSRYSAGSEDEQARNLVTEGENLQAMVTMYRDRGQVDLIVTDPPYNTGRDFRYNDRWEDDPNDPDLGELVTEEDGARHTKWMKFMYPRLRIMRDLLKPQGVLAIFIDHRELFRLGQMLDEIFRGNRIAIINWQRSYTPRNDSGHISTSTEYVLVYAKDVDRAEPDPISWTTAALG